MLLYCGFHFYVFLLFYCKYVEFTIKLASNRFVYFCNIHSDDIFRGCRMKQRLNYKLNGIHPLLVCVYYFKVFALNFRQKCFSNGTCNLEVEFLANLQQSLLKKKRGKTVGFIFLLIHPKCKNQTTGSKFIIIAQHFGYGSK